MAIIELHPKFTKITGTPKFKLTIKKANKYELITKLPPPHKKYWILWPAASNDEIRF